MLLIPQVDLCTHKLAGVLGAPLEAAKDMYMDLTNMYSNCTLESEAINFMKTYNYSTNVTYHNRTAQHQSQIIDDYEVITDGNVAYEDIKQGLRMEENVAYEPAHILVSHNAAYAGVGRPQDELEKQDDYD